MIVLSPWIWSSYLMRGREIRLDNWTFVINMFWPLQCWLLLPSGLDKCYSYRVPCRDHEQCWSGIAVGLFRSYSNTHAFRHIDSNIYDIPEPKPDYNEEPKCVAFGCSSRYLGYTVPGIFSRWRPKYSRALCSRVINGAWHCDIIVARAV